jgi:hypothetical protein
MWGTFGGRCVSSDLTEHSLIKRMALRDEVSQRRSRYARKLRLCSLQPSAMHDETAQQSCGAQKTNCTVPREDVPVANVFSYVFGANRKERLQNFGVSFDSGLNETTLWHQRNRHSLRGVGSRLPHVPAGSRAALREREPTRNPLTNVGIVLVS